ncbi:hypothetical protein GGR54DRAFT_635795 [Hypoxylon sp. NC1633]|nr:hypothetical protein GGR54DRAFT_635795 [Hypoxylon sp. NC1633]
MAPKPSSIPTIRRALFYVPASSPRFMTKSLSLSSDNITYDLEDSVSHNAKPAARAALHAHLSALTAHPQPTNIAEIAVRINGGRTELTNDLTTIAPFPSVNTIVVPKVSAPQDIEAVTTTLQHLAPARYAKGTPTYAPHKIVALIETARAVTDLREICAASPQLDGLIFGAEDFALDLSLTRTPSLSEFLYARSAIVTAARAAKLSSVTDLVCTTYAGEEGLARLEEECRGGKAMGFDGKQCIHPSQLETVQRLFLPSEKEVEFAVKITIADEKAVQKHLGAWTLDGAMIDAPVIRKARALVDKAERCGIDVHSLREKWKLQEPTNSAQIKNL